MADIRTPPPTSQATAQRAAPLRAPAGAGRIPVLALGGSLSLFLMITFALCVGFDLLFPGQAMYQTWLQLFPGFTWLSWSSFFLGLSESFVYGWYVALVFAPLYNLFAARAGGR